MVEVTAWERMRSWSAELLERRTGEGVDEWNRRVAGTGIGTEAELREWLAGQGVTGYAQMLLVMERFGYPDFLTADASALVDGQYADRPALRPVYDKVVALAAALDEVEVGARKTYVTLSTPRRKFAVVKATTKTRVDLGLRLDGIETTGRLESPQVLRDDALTARIPLQAPEDVDEEVADWLARAAELSR
ncbi:hypothetical protein FPZ12_031955 [Amycolatopsis acidicola]|uniref:DUF5655 domain-containing protein n=1 Tax=Amycolatopsis acidicola TaxID=2596893 RepID=A0A5N0UTL9_9PSEU|nr:DUF5655 domain-containing protein [Amycolatopsis acidicola]KAA9154512.1 hypothetical protein FPZ12_031955 [Amycolatopsis acidicola]